MRYSGDDPKDNAHQLVIIQMLDGDNPNVASRLHSTDQTEENILLEEYFP